jgi:hypothetical protein
LDVDTSANQNPRVYHYFFRAIIVNMSCKNILPNPYGRERLDLSLVFIPAANIEWFARDVMAEKHSAAHWEKTYNLKPDTCSRWARMYVKNGFIAERGRPRKFSVADKKELKAMVDQRDYDTRTT